MSESDAWQEIQAIKTKRNSLREKLQKRRKERQDILNSESGIAPSETVNVQPATPKEGDSDSVEPKSDLELEKCLLQILCEMSPNLPASSTSVCPVLNKKLGRNVSQEILDNLLQKFSTQQLISLETNKDGKGLDIISAEHVKLQAMINEVCNVNSSNTETKRKLRNEAESAITEPLAKVTKVVEKEERKTAKKTDIMSLLSMPSIKEKESKRVGEEILELLSKPTAKERSLAERFRSNGAQVTEFCAHGTRAECTKENKGAHCNKLHFKKIIQKHTDESLGDCSFLNTCFHMDSCKVDHDVETFTEEKQVMLTQKDQAVLDEESDALVNVNMLDEEQYKKNIFHEVKKPFGYNGIDTGEMDVDEPKGVSSKYDDEIEGLKKVKPAFTIGEENAEAKKISIKRALKEKANMRLEPLALPELKIAN